MYRIYKTLTNISLLIFLMIGLTACGGGSGGGTTTPTTTENTTPTNSENTASLSSGDATPANSGDTTGTGNTTSTDPNNTTPVGNDTEINNKCVSVPRPKVGRNTIHKSDSSIIGGIVGYIEETVTAISNTSFSTTRTERQGTPDGAITSRNDTTEIFTIANNFRDITKSTTRNLSTDPNSNEVLSTSVIEFSPHQRAVIDTVCENQTLTTTNTRKITTTTPNPSGGDDIVLVDESAEINETTLTVELVNVQKTVPAGTFTTFQLKETGNDDDSVILVWIDIATGIVVALEFYDTPNSLLGVTELISFSTQ